MANERGPGQGIIRLSGPAIDRPRDNLLQGTLTPAAIELMTGMRVLTGRTLNYSHSSSKNALPQPSSDDSTPRNFLEYDDWGE